MAARFLIFICPSSWRARSIKEAQERVGFERAHSSRSVVVLVSHDSDRLEIGNGKGVIVGTLFAKGRPSLRLRTIGDELRRSIEDDGVAALRDGTWGSYVAVVEAGTEGGGQVVRDPSGALPCYLIRVDGMTVMASDLGTLTRAGLLTPEVCYPSLARHLRHPEFRGEETCIQGVTELLAGEGIAFGKDRLEAMHYWSPWDHVAPAWSGDLQPAAEELRDVSCDCIQSWANCFDHVLLGMSGGLDSSIVAAGLHEQAKPFTALTMVTRGPEGDERYFARTLARALDVELVESIYEVEEIDLRHSRSGHLPRPVSRAFEQEIDRTRQRVVRERGVDAFFDGTGGDNVFCYMQSATPIVDRAEFEGLGRGVWRTVDDICRLTGCTGWEALAKAVAKALSRERAYRWGLNDRFLTPMSEAAAKLDHPWLTPPPSVARGKAVHVAAILRIQNYLDRYRRESALPTVAPLLSQPMLELCLSIPTWMWSTDGRDRAVARQAFKGMLPELIIQRRSKGGPDSFAVEIFETNRSVLRELLLGGRLRAHDVIDSAAIESFLDDPRPPRGPDYARILALAAAEAWAETITTVSPKADSKAA